MTPQLVISGLACWVSIAAMCVSSGMAPAQAAWWPIYGVKWLLRTFFCALFTGWRGK